MVKLDYAYFRGTSYRFKRNRRTRRVRHCCIEGGSWFTETFFLNIGIVAGATASAIFAREFKLRIPKSPVRYIQSIGGGIIMGYGAGLGLGCTLGAFFSAVPSMALNGWVYAIGLTIGSYLSVQWIKRFP